MENQCGRRISFLIGLLEGHFHELRAVVFADSIGNDKPGVQIDNYANIISFFDAFEICHIAHPCLVGTIGIKVLIHVILAFCGFIVV